MKYQGQIIEWMERVNEFFKDLEELIPDGSTTNLSIFKRIKLLYYIKLKYPFLRKLIYRLIFNYLKKALNDPLLFMHFVTEGIVILESYVTSHKNLGTIQEFIDRQFGVIYHNKSPITMIVKKVNADAIESCKIVIHTANQDIHKLVHLELDIDFINYRWEVEMTIYNDIEGRHVEKMKTFTILPDGKLYSYIYAIDKSLIDEDMRYFKAIAMFVMGPIAYLLNSILSYEFVLYKKN